MFSMWGEDQTLSIDTPFILQLKQKSNPVFHTPPFAPLWVAAWDHFIVPRTPFRMANTAIHIRPSSKAGFCIIFSGLRFNGKKIPR
jgi:hypothetical protein